MPGLRIWLMAAMGAAGLAAASTTSAAESTKVTIGVLTDMSGVFADVGGPGAVDAARMAIEDFGGSVLGRPVELISGDHQNKPDVGALLARRWFDENDARMVIDLTSSAVAFAVQKLAVDKDRIAVATSAASSDITGKFCNPNTFAWGYDSYSMSHVAVPELVREGYKNWYLIAPDYAYGHAAIRDVGSVVESGGGKVIGNVKHPLNASDFSSFLLQAQAAKPQVIGVLNAINDLQNTMKQGREFGVFGPDVKVVIPALMAVDVHAAGLEAMQGTYVSSAVFYWDLNDKTREFSKRFMARNKNRAPSESQAMNYSVVLHYLKAVKAAGTTDTKVVLGKMREMPVEDPMTDRAMIRADGRLMRPSYLAQVKSPEESKGDWDFYKIIRTVPAEQAFRPAAESECRLLKP